MGKDDEKKMDYDYKEQANSVPADMNSPPIMERNAIRELQTNFSIPKLDETWCLVDAKWFDKWKYWVRYDEKTMDVEDKDLATGGSRPGKIDNSHLLKDDTCHLRRDLIQEVDYTIVHEKVWNTFCDWYTGAPCIARKVVEQGLASMKETKVDLFPIFLKWGYADDSQPDRLPLEENHHITQICRTLEFQKLREMFELKDTEDTPGVKNEVRLNMRLGVLNKTKKKFPNPSEDDKKRYIEISPEENTLEVGEFEFEDGDLHLVVAQKINEKWSFLTPEPFEYRIGDMYDIRDTRHKYYEGYIVDDSLETYQVHYINWNSKWDETIKHGEHEDRFFKRNSNTTGPHIPNRQKTQNTYSDTNSNYSSYYSGGYNQNEKGKSVCRGIVGLRNLGNTCFMNSTLQCLMQSPWLTEYFLNDDWKAEINRNNPLGKNGLVAEQYGALVRNIFENEYRVVSPRDFKKVIGEFAPRFMGYQQQDSQELLAFLLDGLHEDLNRIKIKPYTENVESNGRDDNIVANETWTTYLERNNSIIVDKLQGQYKSKLVCPDCGRTSITFDPFMYLTVPLPTEKYKLVPITFLHGDGSPPKKYGIKVLKEANIADLKKQMGKQFDIDPKWFAIADIWKHKVYKRLNDHEMVNVRSTDDIWVYDATPKKLKQNQKENSPMLLDEPPMLLDEPEAGLGENEINGEPDRMEPTFLINEVQHVAKSIDYSFAEDNIGVPLFMTLVVTDDLTLNHVYDQICALIEPCVMKPDEEDMDEDIDGPPFSVTYEEENMSRYSMGPTRDLNPTNEIFDVHRNVKFTVHWKNIRRYNTKLYEYCEIDDSFPKDVGMDHAESSVPLASCLDAFTEEEVLSEDNAWYCSECQKFQMATKKIDLWRLPDLLVIHLKRFSVNHYRRQKINTLVEFPLRNLDLKDWVSPNCSLKQSSTYDLFGASMHSGGLGGGHYTAYIKSLVSEDWYYLNDSSASTAVGEAIQTPAAYLLFYSRNTKRWVRPNP